MHINSQEQLKKQKRKLSLMFTIILFGIVTGLQVLLLMGRYIESSNREFKRMASEFPRVKMMSTVFLSGNRDQFPPMPMMPGEGKGWRLKGGNLVVYSQKDDHIVLSSLGDASLTEGILKKIREQENIQGTITYNNEKLLFIKENIDSGHQGFFFIPAQMDISDVVENGIIFILFFGLCSFLFYYVIYWFVGKVFLPIEENMQDMEQFIFNAGHELKTPLSVIKSHLQLALVKKQYKTPIDESIKEIDKMNTLLDALVNVSVVHQETQKELLDIAQEADYIVGQYAQHAKKNKIMVTIEREEPCSVTANRGHIHMLISNLLSNAIKYNKKGGKIKISIGSGALQIQDTGVGIPQKDIEKVFDRFYQVGNVRNQEGFGIGLALVKKIIDIYGWKIETQSEENLGTTFTIRFL